HEPLVVVSGVALDDADVWIEIVRAGGWGIGAFNLSLDGGETWEAEDVTVPANGVQEVGGLELSLQFAQSFTLGEAAEFEAVLLSAVTSEGTTPPVVTASGTPEGSYEFVIDITTAGASDG